MRIRLHAAIHPLQQYFTGMPLRKGKAAMKIDGTHTSEKRLRRSLLFVPIGLLLIPQPAHCQALQPGSSDTRRAVYDSRAFSGPSTPLPVWDNGYLVSRDIETSEAGDSNVRLYDQAGKQVGQAAIWFPDSQRVLIYSATATPEGRIVAAGKAEKADGAHASF